MEHEISLGVDHPFVVDTEALNAEMVQAAEMSAVVRRPVTRDQPTCPAAPAPPSGRPYRSLP